MWNEGCGLMDGTISKEDLTSNTTKLKSQSSNCDKLCFTLAGVMHFVDKWLTDKERKEKDEIIRAQTMRAKTLKLVEDLEAENEVLKLQLNELLNITSDKLNNFGFEVVKLDNGHYTLVECKTRYLGVSGE